MGCIYKLTSPSGKSYIGMSKHGIEKRWAKHVEHALGKRSAGFLYAALRKYGAQAFLREVIHESHDQQELGRLEIAAIKAHGTRWPNGYNLTDGGEGAVGYVFTDGDKKKISAAQRLRYQEPEQREKLLAYGAKARAAKSAAAKIVRDAKKIERIAYLASAEFKSAHSASIKAAMSRPESKAKTIAAAKARAANPEWRAKISAVKTGVSTGPCSEQRKRLISEARKREWADPVIRARRLAAFAITRAAKREAIKE